MTKGCAGPRVACFGLDLQRWFAWDGKGFQRSLNNAGKESLMRILTWRSKRSVWTSWFHVWTVCNIRWNKAMQSWQTKSKNAAMKLAWYMIMQLVYTTALSSTVDSYGMDVDSASNNGFTLRRLKEQIWWVQGPWEQLNTWGWFVKGSRLKVNLMPQTVHTAMDLVGQWKFQQMLQLAQQKTEHFLKWLSFWRQSMHSAWNATNYGMQIQYKIWFWVSWMKSSSARSMISRCREKIAEVFGEMKDSATEQNRWESADRYQAVENMHRDGWDVRVFSLEGVHWQIQKLKIAQGTVSLAQSSNCSAKRRSEKYLQSSTLLCSDVDFIGLQFAAQGWHSRTRDEACWHFHHYIHEEHVWVSMPCDLEKFRCPLRINEYVLIEYCKVHLMTLYPGQPDMIWDCAGWWGPEDIHGFSVFKEWIMEGKYMENFGPFCEQWLIHQSLPYRNPWSD